MKPTAAEWQRAETVFHALAGLPAAEQERQAAAHCGDDTVLLTLVRRLLAGHAAADDGFLDPPEPAQLPEIEAGALIDGCRLLRKVGEGGMGTVWLAEDMTLRRQVAIKLLRPGVSGAAALRRFEQEAAVLARLRHPGIAAVHRAGRAACPFFVLEWIADARPITEHCRRAALSRGRRLALLAQVCDAVQHAHQQAVIHRDLKPANVLVGGDGQPKVIDFGIARLLDQERETLHTRQGDVLGTLCYLSPEQCGGDPDAVDARSDVHALGVLCYEVLTGALPFDVADRPWTEVLRSISDLPPRRPRAVDPSLPRDLEAVLCKALEKDPARRHASAAALADDLRAVREHRPVSARPPGPGYALRLLLRRSPALATALLALLLAILLGGAGSIHFALRASDRADVAEAERIAAQELADFLAGIMRNGNPLAAGADYTMRQALDDAAASLEGRTWEHPAVQARLRIVLGDAYRALAQLAPAERQLTTAAMTLRALPGDQRTALAQAHVALGIVRSLQGRPDEARGLLQEAIALRTALHGDDHIDVAVARARLGAVLTEPLAAEEQLRLALPIVRRATNLPPTELPELLANLAVMRYQRGDHAAAEALWRESLTLFERCVAEDHPHRLKVLGQLANAVRGRDPAAAVALCRQVVAATTRRYGGPHPDVAQAQWSLAFALLDGGDPAAEAEFRAHLQLRRALHGDDHATTASAQTDLGYCLLALDRPAEALPELVAAHAVLAGRPDGSAKASCELLLGLAKCRTGDAAAAEPHLRRAVAMREAAFGADSPRTHNARSALGECLLALGRPAEAEPLMAAALPMIEKAFGAGHRETRTAQARLAAARAALGR